jgi:Putative zinc-finger
MTEFVGCGDIRQSLGVYVVGAIDPAERTIVDAHLSTCRDCREELAGLAGLPALLGRVPLRDVERLALDSADLRDLEEPPAELLDSLLRRIAARRRARRWRGLAAAAAAAVIAVSGGIGGGLIISQASTSGVPDLGLASNPITHVSAAISYTPEKSGTGMKVLVTGVRSGTLCQFWVMTSGGQRLLVGSWTVNGNHDTTWYDAWSSVAASQVRSFAISAGGRVLVTIPAT